MVKLVPKNEKKTNKHKMTMLNSEGARKGKEVGRKRERAGSSVPLGLLVTVFCYKARGKETI